MDIGGQVALVTGAGSGLGAATARHLAGLGARVAVLDLTADRAQPVADRVGGLALGADVADAGQVEAAFARVAEVWGAPRVVVNCAGVGTAARIVNREGVLSTGTFAQVIGVNLTGTFNVLAEAARGMMALEPVGADAARGVVVMTASVAYQDGQVGQAAYAASKGGVAAMTLPAARELARAGIRVMTIAPGLFHTPMMEGLPPETTARIVADVPHPPRLGLPEEYAALVAHIVANGYLNGEVIRLDGAVRLPQR